MAIVDQFGNAVYSGGRTFASGANRIDRAGPPEPLHLKDFDALIPEVDRLTLLSGSRKLFQNFGPVLGATIQKADNVIGRAWGPIFTGEDREWGKIAKEWLVDQWYGNCDVRGTAWDFKTLLWLDCVAVDRDGDFLILLTESASGYPLTQRIPANRIGQRDSRNKIDYGKYSGLRITHGVIRDRVNRAVAYRILGDDPADDIDVPAQDVIHVFDPLWHDQVRGIPSSAQALKFIMGSLNSHEWEQMAMLMVSSIGLIEYNETGGPDPDNPTTSFGSVEDGSPTVETLQKGAIKYIRSNSGGKLEQMEHARPGDMWDRFNDRVIRIFSSGINWPYELIWKSGEVNAALVRNIQERARMSVEDRQDTIRGPAKRVMQWAIAKAIKSGILPAPKSKNDWWRWDFGMPRKFSIDPGREAQQRREDYRAGLRTKTSIIREEGGENDDVDAERIEEVFATEKKILEAEKLNGFKMDRRRFFMLAPNEMPAMEDSAEQKDPKKEDKEE